MAASEKLIAVDEINNFQEVGPGDPKFVDVLDVRLTDSIAFSSSSHGEHAEANFSFADKPPEGATVTLTDAAGTPKTFEVDADNNGVSGSNIALNGIVAAGGGATGMAADFVAKINASALQMQAEVRSAGEMAIMQDSPGPTGNKAITYSNNGVWNASVSTYVVPEAFAGGKFYPAPGEVQGFGSSRMGYRRIKFDDSDFVGMGSTRTGTITLDDTTASDVNFAFPNKLNSNAIAVIGVHVRVVELFTGSGLSALTMSVGVGGTGSAVTDTDLFITASNIHSGGAGYQAGHFYGMFGQNGDANLGAGLTQGDHCPYLHRASASERITLTFASTGTDLNAMTAGKLDLFVRFYDLWAQSS